MKEVKQILDNNNTVSKMKSILSYIRYNKCSHNIIRDKDAIMFGLDRVDLLSCLMEEYYQYRYEDENGVNPNIELYKNKYIESKEELHKCLEELHEYLEELNTIKNRSFLERVFNKDF